MGQGKGSAIKESTSVIVPCRKRIEVVPVDFPNQNGHKNRGIVTYVLHIVCK